MELVDYARRELETSGLFSKDSDYEGLVGEAVMELVEVFAKQGHSGFSASMTSAIFKRLAEFNPLNPITGDEEEWGDPVDSEGTLQNKRCSALFKDGKSGSPYYIYAIMWKSEDGIGFHGSAKLKDGTLVESSQFVNLPFVPKTFTIDVINWEKSDDFVPDIKDASQLEAVFDYYIRPEELK